MHSTEQEEIDFNDVRTTMGRQCTMTRRHTVRHAQQKKDGVVNVVKKLYKMPHISEGTCLLRSKPLLLKYDQYGSAGHTEVGRS